METTQRRKPKTKIKTGMTFESHRKKMSGRQKKKGTAVSRTVWVGEAEKEWAG